MFAFLCSKIALCSWDFQYIKWALLQQNLQALYVDFRVSTVQCTVVNKGIRIEILFFELGHFSEGLMFVTIGEKGIFGLSLHKKKF